MSNRIAENEWWHRYLEDYLYWLRKQNYRKNSVRVYVSRLGSFLQRMEESVIVESTKCPHSATELVAQHLRYLSCEQQSCRNTVRSFTSAARSFYKFHGLELQSMGSCLNDKLMPEQPPLTKEELASLLASISGPSRDKERAMVLLIVYCGLRLCELVQLNAEDLQIHSSEVYLSISAPQNRRIKLPWHIASDVLFWLALRPEFAQPDEAALFVSDKGTRITAGGIAFLLQFIGQKARLTISVRRLLASYHSNQSLSHSNSLSSGSSLISTIGAYR